MDKTIVKINGVNFQVNFPNVSEHMEIEALKQSLTKGTYGDMVRASTKNTDRNLDLVDALATFTVLIPDIRKQFAGKSLLQVDMRTGLALAKAYVEFYHPWYTGIMDELDKEYKNLSKDAGEKGDKQST